ncbi:MAG: DUF5995 family protein [Leptospirales bacterium]
MQAKSIDEIMQNLAGMIQSSRKNRNRAGYFAAFYSRLIVRLRDGVADGSFDDGARVERLTIALANRYFEASALFQQGGRPARGWEIALRANRDFWLLVPQHILLALNAHINLDLAVAVVGTGPAGGLQGFRADFERIDRILNALLEDVLRELSQIWPALNALGPILRGPENSFLRFSLTRAREHAWDLALELDGLNAAARGPILDRHDKYIAAVAETIRNPGILNLPLMTVRLVERGGIAETIELLQ